MSPAFAGLKVFPPRCPTKRSPSTHSRPGAKRRAAISCVFRDNNGFRVRSLGAPADGEAALVQSFYRTIEKYTPQLVSWNGSGFDLPVLHYRALINGIRANRYWDLGEDDREFKWNNYISRYHARHTDLMDLLAMYQARECAARCA